MAVLGNPRHELAAEVLARGGSAKAAAAAGGYKIEASSFESNARKFIQREDLRERVKELQAEVAKQLVDVTVEWIKQNVANIAGVAIADGEVKASDVIAANKLLAQMVPGALVPQKIAPTNSDGDGPVEGNITITLVDADNAGS